MPTWLPLRSKRWRKVSLFRRCIALDPVGVVPGDDEATVIQGGDLGQDAAGRAANLDRSLIEGQSEFVRVSAEFYSVGVLPDDDDLTIVGNIGRAAVANRHIGEGGVEAEAADRHFARIIMLVGRVKMETDVALGCREVEVFVGDDDGAVIDAGKGRVELRLAGVSADEDLVAHRDTTRADETQDGVGVVAAAGFRDLEGYR